MEYTIEECSLQSVRPDVEIKSSRPNVSKSCPKRSYNSFLTRSDFYLSPKSHHTFWLLFEDNLSPKNFQKPPNLVTLALIACVSNRQMGAWGHIFLPPCGDGLSKDISTNGLKGNFAKKIYAGSATVNWRWRLISAQVCSKDLNPRPQNGRSTRIHWAIGAYPLGRKLAYSLKMGQPRPLLLVIFGLFQANIITIFTTNICDKYPFSIRCRDSNPRPLERVSVETKRQRVRKIARNGYR